MTLRANEIRIIGGRWRRRKLPVPVAPGVRPTPDRVRETLFNWLGQDLTGRVCLDLFAGSGALGFEALSRGAEKVVAVERERRTVDALRQVTLSLGAAAYELHRFRLLEAMRIRLPLTDRAEVVLNLKISRFLAQGIPFDRRYEHPPKSEA